MSAGRTVSRVLVWAGSGLARSLHALTVQRLLCWEFCTTLEGEAGAAGHPKKDLCVKWWERGLPAKENMKQVYFVMLLRRSLRTRTVRSLSSVHAALC